jgi:hypothetical protein
VLCADLLVHNKGHCIIIAIIIIFIIIAQLGAPQAIAATLSATCSVATPLLQAGFYHGTATVQARVMDSKEVSTHALSVFPLARRPLRPELQSPLLPFPASAASTLSRNVFNNTKSWFIKRSLPPAYSPHHHLPLARRPLRPWTPAAPPPPLLLL